MGTYKARSEYSKNNISITLWGGKKAVTQERQTGLNKKHIFFQSKGSKHFIAPVHQNKAPLKQTIMLVIGNCLVNTCAAEGSLEIKFIASQVRPRVLYCK